MCVKNGMEDCVEPNILSWGWGQPYYEYLTQHNLSFHFIVFQKFKCFSIVEFFFVGGIFFFFIYVHILFTINGEFHFLLF